MSLISGSERFGADHLFELSGLVAGAWSSGADHDWAVPAGTLEWSCIRTADHAVDCVYAPAFFLASRRVDRYPEIGRDLMLGDDATPARLLESLHVATRMFAAVVRDAEDDVRAIVFRRPQLLLGAPRTSYLGAPWN